jgi:hypothetical protein
MREVTLIADTHLLLAPVLAATACKEHGQVTHAERICASSVAAFHSSYAAALLGTGLVTDFDAIHHASDTWGVECCMLRVSTLSPG